MPKQNHKFINSLTLITTILLASIAPGFAQTANVKIADSQSINQQTSSGNDRKRQACVVTKIQELCVEIRHSRPDYCRV